MMKHKTVKIAVITIALLILATIGGSFFFVDLALASQKTNDPHYDDGDLQKDYPRVKAWADSMRNVKALRDTFITDHTGKLKLHALYARNTSGSRWTALCIHGYTSSATLMLRIGYMFYNMGFNIILPDLHGHGLSGGNDIQMGWLDRLDAMKWVTTAHDAFGKGCDNMVVHGTSMGAATTMCLSGEKLPPYVKCFIEDSGYTSVWDIFSYRMSTQFYLPDFPLLYTADIICEQRYGWNFKEASPLKQITKCRRPMMFIHSDIDNSVPMYMVFPLYKAKPGKKELWIVHGSKHGMAYHDIPKEYEHRVKDFIFSKN